MDNRWDKDTVQAEEMHALDRLYHESSRFRESGEYMQMLEFVANLRTLAPFNAWLIYAQNPRATYVARARDWAHRFERAPKPDARPYVVMFPFGPVDFVFDLEDTEGKPFPPSALSLFPVFGGGFEVALRNLLHNCAIQNISVGVKYGQLFEAGQVLMVDELVRHDYPVSKGHDYLILLNPRLTHAEQFATLIHELAHIFCGHLGSTEQGWWEPNVGREKAQRELEAESVAFIVTRRLGLHLESERYLAGIRDIRVLLPGIRPNTFFQAASYIEEMTREQWKSPKKKAALPRGRRS